MSRSFFVAGILLVIVIISVLVWRTQNEEDQDTSRDFDDAVAEISDATLMIEVSDSPAERRLGLSHIEHLDDSEGMLFVHEVSDVWSFWMKDMNVPIDILWLDAEFKVIDISERLSPDSYRSETDAKTYSPKRPARYVLEVVAGFAERHDVKTGDQLEIVEGALKDVDE